MADRRRNDPENSQQSSAIPNVIPLLLLGSGYCALTYQTTWLHEYRLIFGGSTAATGAVLAVFMGGLGLGAFLVGWVTKGLTRPLWLYGILELLIAGSAAGSPWLVSTSRDFYVRLGGQEELGLFGATVARLVIAVVVLLVPTTLMGATLPIVARAVTSAHDPGRARVAIAYAFNNLGAVIGTLATTFFLLENLGIRATLWITSALNAAIGLTAVVLGARCRVELGPTAPVATAVASTPSAVVAASTTFVTGCVFFVMESVWFRMLAPILGGTTYTFGVILAVALAGIAVGSRLYPLIFRSQPSPSAIAILCACEAVSFAAAFLMGDELAFATGDALVARKDSFWGIVGVWLVNCLVVVFPASVVSGLLFPAAIGMLGVGSTQVHRHVGWIYACNTIGSIAGALLGGFGLISWLGAETTWRVCVAALSLWAIVLVLMSNRRPSFWVVITTASAVAGSLAMGFSGPTAVWRHSQIGVFRAGIPADPTQRQAWANRIRQETIWQADGTEAGIAVHANRAYSFVVNGKHDGNAIDDAGTQILLGMLGAILHPDVKSALVVGLGSGQTAGWLGNLPSMEHVDVVELEAKVNRIAHLCRDSNHRVLDNPKVRLIQNDAREVALTMTTKYDLIASEPSNPYRAGVSSLFTQEFYRSIQRRLKPDGLFIQWLQCYDIDEATLQLAVRTLGSVFAEIECWQSMSGDLLLVCRDTSTPRPKVGLSARVQSTPYRDALFAGWRVAGVEGLASRFLAGDRSLRDWSADAPINTDDRNRLEYGFARSLGNGAKWDVEKIRQAAQIRGELVARFADESVDWDEVESVRELGKAWWTSTMHRGSATSAKSAKRFACLQHYWRADPKQLLELWRQAPWEISQPLEIEILALVHAMASADIEPWKLRLNEIHPPSSIAIDAIRNFERNQLERSAESLLSALKSLQSDPWMFPHLWEQFPFLAVQIGQRRPESARRIYEALREPLAAGLFDWERRNAVLLLASRLDLTLMVDALESFEPNPTWEEGYLERRLGAYQAARHKLAPQAEGDLRRFHDTRAR